MLPHPVRTSAAPGDWNGPAGVPTPHRRERLPHGCKRRRRRFFQFGTGLVVGPRWGSGGFADVYPAIDRETGRAVALKRFKTLQVTRRGETSANGERGSARVAGGVTLNHTCAEGDCPDGRRARAWPSSDASKPVPAHGVAAGGRNGGGCPPATRGSNCLSRPGLKCECGRTAQVRRLPSERYRRPGKRNDATQRSLRSVCALWRAEPAPAPPIYSALSRPQGSSRRQGCGQG